MSQQNRTAAIATLNDAFRKSDGDDWLITAGVWGLGPALIARARRAVAEFADFSEDNDPHGERDFGAFELAGHRLFWKIDCYDLGFCQGSPDPADPSRTRRVMTLMLAEEY